MAATSGNDEDEMWVNVKGVKLEIYGKGGQIAFYILIFMLKSLFILKTLVWATYGNQSQIIIYQISTKCGSKNYICFLKNK